MAPPATPIRIAILGPEESPQGEGRGCGLWAPGYTSAITAAGGIPVALGEKAEGQPWADFLDDVDGLVFTGSSGTPQLRSEDERLIRWCRKRQLPLLAVDNGLLLLNLASGGTIHQNLARELPEALQHRHPPEPGVRHALNVIPDTYLAKLYGEGEIVVNSEHTRAVERVAKGFRVSARALDGVIEAIEGESDDWFVLGVQWRPASGTASGLDIQLFRGLVDYCRNRLLEGATVGAAA